MVGLYIHTYVYAYIQMYRGDALEVVNYDNWNYVYKYEIIISM